MSAILFIATMLSYVYLKSEGMWDSHWWVSLLLGIAFVSQIVKESEA